MLVRLYRYVFDANIVYKRITSVSCRHVQMQSTTHTPSDDIDMDLSATLGLLQLHDEILVKIARSVPVDENIFDFLAKFNKVNKRLNALVTLEMKTDAHYRLEVGEIKNFVPGTRIPCSVDRAPDLPIAYTQEDILSIFDALHLPAPNGVYVSQCFRISNPSMFYDTYNSWEDCENMGDRNEHSVFFVLVDLEFDADYYCENNVPLLRNNQVDLTRMPTVFRTVLGFRMPKMDSDEMDASLSHRVGYTRVVRLHGENTIQDLWNAIGVTEGWKTMLPSSDFDALSHDCSIFDLFEYAADKAIRVRPLIFWDNI